MNLLFTLAEISRADLARLSGLESELAERAVAIGSVYAVLVLIGLLLDVLLVMRWSDAGPAWRAGVSRLCWRPWGLRESRAVLIALACAFAVALLFRGGLQRGAAALQLSPASFLIIVQSMVFHWAGLAAVTVLLARRGVSWSTAFGLTARTFPRAAGWGTAGLLAAMPVLLLCTLVYHLLLQALGHQPSLQDVAFAISGERMPWVRFYFLALAVVIAPAFEEILFRGILLPALARRFGVVFAVVAVSMLFALIHGHAPSMVTLFLLSVVLCMGYLLSGSLATAMVMHGLFNAVTVGILMTLT